MPTTTNFARHRSLCARFRRCLYTKLDADGFTYAYTGAKETFDALEFLTPHKISKKFDDDMKDLCGTLPVGLRGLNKTTRLGNAVNSYLANRTRWASDDGNGLMDKLVEISGGGLSVLRKVVVDKMKSETGWKVRVEKSSYEVQSGEKRASFVIVFPDYFLGQHSLVCLSALTATELGLDTEALKKNNKIALRLAERTSDSPPFPPFMGPDEAVLARWDVVLSYGAKATTLEYLRASTKDLARSQIFAFLHEHVGQAPFPAVWQHR